MIDDIDELERENSALAVSLPFAMGLGANA
jgi:hypothetical protein